MKLYLSLKADKQLRKLPKKTYELIIEKIDFLKIHPFSSQSKKLQGRNGWRVRMGDYRILYTVNSIKTELTILSVTHRKDAYKALHPTS